MAFKKKNHKCKKEIGFIWIDEDFFNYSFEEEIKNYPYTLSVFEMEESSFDINVMNVFVEIMDILTKGKRVLRIVDGYTLQISLTDIKKEMLQQLLSLRKQYNEGNQEDYFDHPHLIGWTRHTETKAMVIIMTNSTGGIKSMYVGKEDRHCYYVNVFNGYQRVLINEDGYGDFYCEDKNFAVYVKE